MMNAYDPPGIEFYDPWTGRTVKYITRGPVHTVGWLVWKHPDGQWVTQCKATDDDLVRLAKATGVFGALCGLREKLEKGEEEATRLCW